jgi:tRNA pseudouridine13 synthase
MSTDSKPLARSPSPTGEQDPSAKRIKLDDIPAPPAVPTSIYSLPPSTFKYCNQDGLVGILDKDGQYHLREQDVGISEYLSREQGEFEGIVKQRFEDFMVYEVDTEGEIVHLKEMGMPEDPFNKPKEKKPEEKEKDTVVEEEEAGNEPVTVEATTSTTTPVTVEAPAPDEPEVAAEDSAEDLPIELQRLAGNKQWTHSTTRALLPLLPSTAITALHDLLLEGRTPPRPPPEAERPSDGGWGGMKRRDHAKEEEEAMNEAANGEPVVLLSGREKYQNQGRDRGRGRGRGVRGGRGGMIGGHMERIKDEREVLSDVSGAIPLVYNQFSDAQAKHDHIREQVITDKAKRTEIHNTIRSLFTGTFETFSREVAGEQGSSRIAIKWAAKGGASKPKPKRQDNDPDAPKIPKYIHFTLQKTNRDTQDCLNHISRILRVDGKTISTCGTKDKRGITVQRVCIQRKGLKLAQIWKAANGLSYGGRTMKQALEERGERGVRIGDLRYSDEYLELGMLKGNHFTITLR